MRLGNKKGFSLTELLVAVLILSMVSAVVAGGIPVARNAYEKVTMTANAQVMMTTAMSALRNELCTAGNVTIDADNKIRYYRESEGGYSELSVGPAGQEGYTEDTIVLERKASGIKRPLVSKASGDGKLYVVYESAELSGGTVIFHGFSVRDKSKEYAKADEVVIRMISPDIFFGLAPGLLPG